METGEASPQTVDGVPPAPAEGKSRGEASCNDEVGKRHTRAQKVKRIETKGARVDAHMESRTVREQIHASLMHKRYRNHHEREEGIDWKYREIYAKIKSGDFGPNELACWTDVISRGMAKSMCSVIEFLLHNGPMTRIEADIFDSCIRLLKSYYTERAALVQKKTHNGRHYLGTTYYPEESTSVYALLVGNGEVPSRSELEAFNKE